MPLPLVAAKKSNRYYLDAAAATPVDPQVVRAMAPYFSATFYNPSSIHEGGVAARQAVEQARKQVAELIAARPEEIVFTSGATESVNLALLGTARAFREHGKHVVTVATEHAATLETLKREGFTVTFVPVSKDGTVNVEQVVAAVREDTILVSLMLVNNELGVIAPVAEIGKALARRRKTGRTLFPLLHTDAAQAAGLLAVDVDKLHVDLLSFTASKMYGPKGVGALYVKKGTHLQSLIFGGNQEHGLRAGTENVPGIVGFGLAANLARRHGPRHQHRLAHLKKVFLHELHRTGITYQVNGQDADTAPSIVNITFAGIDGEELLLRLDAKGVAVSAASACRTSDHPSHVLRAIGLSSDAIRSTLRFSFLHTMKPRHARSAARLIANLVISLH